MSPDQRRMRLGTLCCIGAALGYSISNTFIRFLSVNIDQIWIVTIRESTASLFLLPLLLYEARNGRLSWGTPRARWTIIGCTSIMQLFANIPSVWAMSKVGMVVAVPIFLGINLVFAAIWGQLLLKQKVTLNAILAIGLLIVAILVFNFGATEVHESIAETVETHETFGFIGNGWITTLAVLAACLAGLAFSQEGIAMTYAMEQGMSIVAVAWIVPTVGMVLFLPIKMMMTDWSFVNSVINLDHIQIIIAILGMCLANASSFLMVTTGFRLITVVHVNVINSSQVALCAVCGILFFNEPASPLIVLGLVLSIIGITLISIRPPKRSIEAQIDNL
jgi:drug/metabolite transporter, DME family